jgi:PAS domain S-box-containing protein
MTANNLPNPLLGDGRFRLAFDRAPIGMALVGKDYRVYQVNAALCKALGYEEQELLNQTFSHLTHPDDVNKADHLSTQLFSGEIPSYRLEKRFRTKDGQLVWLDITAVAIRDDQDEPSFGFAMVENITDRRRSEDALRTSEERYRSFVVNSSEAIWRLEVEQPIDVRLPVDEQIDKLNKYSYLAECNDALARLYGYQRAEEVIGVQLGKLISAYGSSNQDRLRSFISNGYRLHDASAMVHDRAGGDKYLSGSFIGIVVNNYLLRVWGTQRDETAKHLAEAMVTHSRQQLRVLAAHLQDLREKERAHLAREMHDALGQALTGLKLDLARVTKDLTAEPDAETRSRILSRLESVGESLDKTIAQVKTISTELRPAVLDKLGLAAAIEWQCNEFEKRTGISCDSRLPATDSSFGPERSIALFRILQESLTNVARHSGAAHVTVTLEAGEADVSLSIRDDGRGISAAEIAAPESLGLLGMRERTEMLGGHFTVEGQSQGTILSARIPFDSIEDNDGGLK